VEPKLRPTRLLDLRNCIQQFVAKRSDESERGRHERPRHVTAVFFKLPA